MMPKAIQLGPGNYVLVADIKRISSGQSSMESHKPWYTTVVLHDGSMRQFSFRTEEASIEYANNIASEWMKYLESKEYEPPRGGSTPSVLDSLFSSL